MPLSDSIRQEIHEYCVRDLQGDVQWHIDKFDFVESEELRNRLGRAFYSARYIYKLMEATFVKGDELHPFVKVQIIQYASIYEAVVTYLLWEKFNEHEEVIKLQTHKSYRPVSALGSLTKMEYDGDKIFTCVYKDAKTPKNSIPFKEKVDCAVRIGFIKECYSEDIKRIYELRNLTHLETEARKEIEIEIEQAKNGYWRLDPFLRDINEYLSSR